MKSGITIQPISAVYAAQLIELLNHDPGLSDMQNGKRLTVEEYLAGNAEWSAKHHAQLFAIVNEGIAIGSISLAHIDREQQSASCGYWLASAERRKGYAKEAFRQIIQLAGQLGLRTLTSKIKKENTDSLKIWEPFNPTYHDLNDKWLLKIIL